MKLRVSIFFMNSHLQEYLMTAIWQSQNYWRRISIIEGIFSLAHLFLMLKLIFLLFSVEGLKCFEVLQVLFRMLLKGKCSIIILYWRMISVTKEIKPILEFISYLILECWWKPKRVSIKLRRPDMLEFINYACIMVSLRNNFLYPSLNVFVFYWFLFENEAK